MSDFSKGDLVLFKYLDQFMVLRVEFVRAKTLTGFPYVTNTGRWSKLRRRIDRRAVIEKLVPATDVPAFMYQVEALRHRRDAKLQNAKAWFQHEVFELAREAS